jgi:hypothetical protein
VAFIISAILSLADPSHWLPSVLMENDASHIANVVLLKSRQFFQRTIGCAQFYDLTAPR